MTVCLDAGRAQCAGAAPPVTGNTSRWCWSGWAPRAGTHETSLGTREQISLQTDSSLSLSFLCSSRPSHGPQLQLRVIIWPGLLVSCGHRNQASCHHHAPHTRISVSFCKILFIKPPWACHKPDRKNDIIMKLMRTRDSDH